MPSDIDVFNAHKRHTSTAFQKSLTLTAGISNFRDFFAKIRVAWPELFFRNWSAIFVPLNMSASFWHLNKGFDYFGRAVFVKISQNLTKSPLKTCQISQISVRGLWHVWVSMLLFKELISFFCCLNYIESRAKWMNPEGVHVNFASDPM